MGPSGRLSEYPVANTDRAHIMWIFAISVGLLAIIGSVTNVRDLPSECCIAICILVALFAVFMQK